MRGVNYLYAAAGLQGLIKREWSERIARQMHVADGFSIVAMRGDRPVGVVTVVWRQLPQLAAIREGHIDLIEVAADCRRQGIARQLLKMAEQRARAEGMHQLRAWSSEDELETIAMWPRIGFALCPANADRTGEESQGFYASKVL